MLSIVPLLAGGGLYETGAGGSAPKHVQQFVEEGHLRWDSLGEYLAVAVSLEELGNKTSDERVTRLGQTLTEATGKLLSEGKSPSRKVNELDNRGSSFYLAMYWAEAMAAQDADMKSLAEELRAAETTIVSEMIDCQGTPVDIGGYYQPDPVKTSAAMRPSATFNAILDN
jgi:isocitrate dehydrogenase|tara:strand:+ start:1966 stop:2475 length:510 start_codon:yes stop_codon:yes gene_type:complete